MTVFDQLLKDFSKKSHTREQNVEYMKNHVRNLSHAELEKMITSEYRYMRTVLYAFASSDQINQLNARNTFDSRYPTLSAHMLLTRISSFNDDACLQSAIGLMLGGANKPRTFADSGTTLSLAAGYVVAQSVQRGHDPSALLPLISMFPNSKYDDGFIEGWVRPQQCLSESKFYQKEFNSRYSGWASDLCRAHFELFSYIKDMGEHQPINSVAATKCLWHALGKTNNKDIIKICNLYQPDTTSFEPAVDQKPATLPVIKL